MGFLVGHFLLGRSFGQEFVQLGQSTLAQSLVHFEVGSEDDAEDGFSARSISSLADSSRGVRTTHLLAQGADQTHHQDTAEDLQIESSLGIVLDVFFPIDVHLGFLVNPLVEGSRNRTFRIVEIHVLILFLDTFGRQGSQVGLYERLDLVEGKAAHEEERKVVRSGKTLAVDLFDARKIHPVVLFGLVESWQGTRIAVAQQFLFLVLEIALRIVHCIGYAVLHVLFVHLEVLIGKVRRGEIQVDELESLFHVFLDETSAHPLEISGDVRHYRHVLAGQQLLQVGIADTVYTIQDGRSVGNVDVILGRVERTPTPAGSREEDLVVLERSGLEHHLGTVGERPLGYTHLGIRFFRNHPSGLRSLLHQLGSGHTVFVGLDRLVFFHGIEYPDQFLGRGIRLSLGTQDDDHAVVVGDQALGQGIYLLQGNGRQGSLDQVVLESYPGNRFVFQESTDVLIDPVFGQGLVAVGIALLIAGEQHGLGTFQFAFRKSITLCAFRLGQQSLEGLHRTSGGTHGYRHEGIRRTQQRRIARSGVHERSTRLLGHFGKALGKHQTVEGLQS